MQPSPYAAKAMLLAWFQLAERNCSIQGILYVSYSITNDFTNDSVPAFGIFRQIREMVGTEKNGFPGIFLPGRRLRKSCFLRDGSRVNSPFRAGQRCAYFS